MSISAKIRRVCGCMPHSVKIVSVTPLYLVVSYVACGRVGYATILRGAEAITL